MTKSDAVLIHLTDNKAVRRGEHGWKWSERNKGNPSLADSPVSRLFRADLVTEVDSELTLTSMGKIVAERLKG